MNLCSLATKHERHGSLRKPRHTPAIVSTCRRKIAVGRVCVVHRLAQSAMCARLMSESDVASTGAAGGGACRGSSSSPPPPFPNPPFCRARKQKLAELSKRGCWWFNPASCWLPDRATLRRVVPIQDSDATGKRPVQFKPAREGGGSATQWYSRCCAVKVVAAKVYL